ncbi:short-chain dehydrogenase [Raoultella planticola]|nr:short-chain dehydrogenase [Raoultella planticola]
MLVKIKLPPSSAARCDRLRRGACYGARGARVYLGARDRQKLDRVAGEIRAAGGRAETFIVDLLDERSTAERIAQLTQQSGGLDIVVNATGFVHNQGKEITTLSLAEFMQGITRSGGPVQRRKPLPLYGRRSPGRHYHRRSSGGSNGHAGPPGHIVGCAGSEAFIKALASELGPENIRVLGVRSHAITGAVEAGSYTAEVFAAKAQAMGLTVEQWVGGAAHSTMLKRLPTLTQVADVITFLASDRADAMTATVVNMTAGATTGG